MHDLTGDCSYRGNETLDLELAAIDPVETICRRRRPRLLPADLAAITTARRAAVQYAAAQWLNTGPASRSPEEANFGCHYSVFVSESPLG